MRTFYSHLGRAFGSLEDEPAYYLELELVDDRIARIWTVTTSFQRLRELPGWLGKVRPSVWTRITDPDLVVDSGL